MAKEDTVLCSASGGAIACKVCVERQVILAAAKQVKQETGQVPQDFYRYQNCGHCKVGNIYFVGDDLPGRIKQVAGKLKQELEPLVRRPKPLKTTKPFDEPKEELPTEGPEMPPESQEPKQLPLETPKPVETTKSEIPLCRVCHDEPVMMTKNGPNRNGMGSKCWHEKTAATRAKNKAEGRPRKPYSRKSSEYLVTLNFGTSEEGKQLLSNLKKRQRDLFFFDNQPVTIDLGKHLVDELARLVSPTMVLLDFSRNPEFKTLLNEIKRRQEDQLRHTPEDQILWELKQLTVQDIKNNPREPRLVKQEE